MSLAAGETNKTQCGFESGPCCEGEPKCLGPLLSCTEGVCGYDPRCGGDGQVCCVPDKCQPGSACVDGRCTVVCGAPGQACCSGETACYESKACVNGVCQQCGNDGELCCAGDRCNGQNLCIDDECKSCGRDGLPCCVGNCYDGSLCSSTTMRCMLF